MTAKAKLRGPQLELVNTPPGMGHVRWMAKRMAKLAQEGSHSWAIRQLATAITHGVPSKSPTAELLALYKWVRNEIRYRHDPVGLELLQKPEVTVKERAGDCDDMATLLGALAGALGHPWRFRTVGPSPEDQAHVQLQAHDKKRWIDLDPVLEPAPSSTAWSDDPGRFGAFAVGAEHLFNSEGTMLKGPTTAAERRLWNASLGSAMHRRLRGERTLAGPTSATDRELWEFVPYFPPVGPAPYGGSQPPMPGAYPTVDTAYRSPDAPGFMNGKPFSVVYELPAGSVASESLDGLGRITVHHPTLGAGFLRKLKKGVKKVGKGLKKGVTTVVRPVAQVAHNVTHKGPIAKIQKAVHSVAKAIPVLKPFVELQEKIFQPGTEALLNKAGVIKSKAKMPTLKTIKSALPAAAAAASTSSGGKVAIPKEAAAAAAKVKAISRALPRPPTSAAKALQPAIKAAQAAAAKARAAVVAKPPAVVKDAWKQPHAELKAKYPASARMMFDPGSKRFRVFVPTALLHGVAIGDGLGGIIPTLTFTLGAAPSTPTAIQNAKDKAAKMEAALKTFITKNKRPPAIALPAVTAFQQSEGTLKADGLYGTNTKAAGEYYLNRKLPANAPGLNSALTWHPPTATAQPAAPTPVVKPAAPSPVVKVPIKPAVPIVTVKPVQPATPTPTPVKPAQPTNALPVPSGYKEVGSETNNPGLPPVGYGANVPPPGPGTTQADMVKATALLDAAKALERAVRAFIDKNKRPPAIALPAVRDFQVKHGGLAVDGLYGLSTKAAAEKVLGHALPATAPGLNKPSSPSSPNNPPSPNWTPGGLVPSAPVPAIPTTPTTPTTPPVVVVDVPAVVVDPSTGQPVKDPTGQPVYQLPSTPGYFDPNGTPTNVPPIQYGPVYSDEPAGIPDLSTRQWALLAAAWWYYRMRKRAA